ncbi:SAM-dependent methyltransferase [Actinoallomurus bryophytorum]|uniref:S-adenosyl methyltransferase n=1 Tax=Actinoallomurus bryophytorum TaxID=1490222 RepID=A0A543C036_9ACTN|nr:SAM-dependent methyltransferase [Actinoallomurus bryophytorum]TQL90444.1 S-adenosyl methyltransferase [Actinoallomurus bryophytorum]
MTDRERALQGVDTNVPSVARVYDYLLGGKDNFAVDRQVAELILEISPDAPATGRANREFLERVVRYLAGEAGVRQFIDLGSGLPTQGNVHQIAQGVDPAARVVYVDNDPIVLTHGQALLAEDGATTIVQGDIREPKALLDHAGLRQFIDFSRPVGLLLFAILHHLKDEEDPRGIATRLLAGLPAGSYIAISHFHNPGPALPAVAEQVTAGEKLFNERLGTGRWRTREEILAYFGGLEPIEPGLVPLLQWRPSPSAAPHVRTAAELAPLHYAFLGGVARKP